jgi:hypothetical protein
MNPLGFGVEPLLEQIGRLEASVRHVVVLVLHTLAQIDEDIGNLE